MLSQRLSRFGLVLAKFPYNGMLSCFFQGFARCLLRSVRSRAGSLDETQTGPYSSNFGGAALTRL